MRRTLAIGVVLALAVIALGSSLASGSGSDRTIRLVAQTAQVTEVDLGDEGFSQGDQIVFRDHLFRGGRRAGTGAGTCTAVQAEEGAVAFHCAGTLSLADGQVTLQGLMSFVEGEEIPRITAVTGGTGRYRGVGGEMLIETVAEGEDRYTLRLTLPKR